MQLVRCAAGALGLLALGLTNSAASAVEDFYKGRQMSIVVGHQTGTGFDLYARTLAKFMGGHIPGKPTIIVQNMTGASGLKSLNFLAKVAPKDGSVFATMVFSAPFEPLMGEGKGLFDATRFLWIGNMDSSVSIFGVSRKSGVKRFEDLFQKEIVVGGTGRAGPLNQVPNALRNLLGAKIKVVTGYKGSASVKIAIQRGELDGAAGISWSTIKTQYQDIRKEGDFNMILQVGPKPHPELPQVRHVYDFAKTEDDRQIFDLVFGVQGLGRAFMAPDGVPAERGAALRKAFVDTMADKALRAEADKIKLDLNPQSGEDVEAFVKKIYATPKRVIVLARDAIKGEGEK
ncbi:MAG: hypothetical protein RLZ98_3497 [Pseudomonadota bacterium]|jgi:tripartite-type tricarboxylate transporter receptor subunit TctC